MFDKSRISDGILRGANTVLKSETEERFMSEVTGALTRRNLEGLRGLTRQMATAHPFLYSFLNDTLRAASTDGAHGNRQTDEFLRVVSTRMRSLANWRQQGNETVAAIEAGDIDANAIKPHIRLEAKAYDEFYAEQSEKIGGKLATVPPAGRDVDYVPIELGPNVNHAFRSTHAVSLVEMMLGTIALLSDREGPIRWIDVGCGTGRFANGVNPRRFGVEKWEIVGCDFQEGKIAVANRRRARGRSFFRNDAFDMLEDHRKRGEPFHLVSMFEFLQASRRPTAFRSSAGQLQPELRAGGVALGAEDRQPAGRQARPGAFVVVYPPRLGTDVRTGGLRGRLQLGSPRRQLYRRARLADDRLWAA